MKNRRTANQTIEDELEQMQGLPVPDLCNLYRTRLSEEPRVRHRQHLVRELGWRIQACAHGGLPEDVKQYALGIARASELRTRISTNSFRRRNGAPLDRTATIHIATNHDPRLPLPGSLLIKDYKGQTYVIKTLDHGFEYNGDRYSSLSAIARAISGTKWNGYLFFGLTKAVSHAG